MQDESFEFPYKKLIKKCLFHMCDFCATNNEIPIFQGQIFGTNKFSRIGHFMEIAIAHVKSTLVVYCFHVQIIFKQ